MSVKRPPKKASPENLLELCEVLREGVKTREELTEVVDHSEGLVRENLQLGVALGFVIETEEGFKTTSLGVEASYSQDNPEELARQFQEGLSKYQVYKTVLRELSNEGHSVDGPPITKSDVLRIFRTSVGLEGSDSTLGGRTTTFIQTLEKAGLGEYVLGRRGKETRLEVSEEFDEIVEQILEVPDESEEEAEESELAVSDKDSQSRRMQNTDSPDSREAPLQIKLELSGDEDPNRVEELIVGVRRGLARDLKKVEVDDQEDTDAVEEKAEEENEDNGEVGDEEENLDLDEGNQGEDGADSDSSDESLKSFINEDLVEEKE